MKKILAAKVLKHHGLHGALKIACFLEDFPKYYHRLINDQGESVPITSCTLLDAKHNYYIIKLQELTKVEDTLKFIGRQWFIDDDQLASTEENNYYYHQLIGLPVVDDQNNSVGIVEDLDNMGAGDMVVIRLNINTLVYLPFDLNTFPQVYQDKIIISQDGLDYIFDQ